MTRVGGTKNAYRVLVGKPEGRRQPGRLIDINEGKVLLKYIIKKQDGLMWNGLIWLRIETGGWLL